MYHECCTSVWKGSRYKCGCNRSDGLESLQESQMKKQQAAKAGKKEEDSKPARHNLNWTVQLLAACRKDELDKLEKWQGVPRCVAMYRCDPCQS